MHNLTDSETRALIRKKTVDAPSWLLPLLQDLLLLPEGDLREEDIERLVGELRQQAQQARRQLSPLGG